MGTSDFGAEIAVDVIDDSSSFIRSGLYSENEIGMLEVSVKGNPSVINKHEINSESKFMKERDDIEGGSLKRDGQVLKERAMNWGTFGLICSPVRLTIVSAVV